MRKPQVWLYWLFGGLVMAGMMALLWRIGGLRYENSDDGLILKTFMGFEGDAPANFSLYIHTFLAWALYGLSSLAKGIPWFSLYQLGLLWFSGTVVFKSMLQLAQPNRRPWLAGALAGLLFLIVFVAFIACRINYTTTAALAGGAAVVQLMTVKPEGGSQKTWLCAFVLSLFLLLNAYCLRAQSAWPALAFCGLVLVWRFAAAASLPKRKAIWRRMAAMLASMVLLIVALAGIRLLEIQVRGLQPQIDWHGARTALMDFTAFESDPAPALAANSGLSSEQVRMMQKWYFMDGDMTASAMQTMADAYAATPDEGAIARLGAFFASNPKYLLASGLLILLCGLCWLLNGGKVPFSRAAAAFALAGGVALVVLLALRGRMLSRAVDVALIPCAAFLLGAVLQNGVRAGLTKPLRTAAVLCFVAMLAVAGLHTKTTLHQITRKPDLVSMQREDELERYAMQNADTLVVRSPDLLRDTRLLVDGRGGVPGNIILWGDWSSYTPGWYAQLAQYGFDGEHFVAENWLAQNIVLATAQAEDMQDWTAYLRERLGRTVTPMPVGEEGTLTFYRIVADATAAAE